MKDNYSARGIFNYSFPILVGAILEELMILTDSVFLSFKEPVFLSTVGIIDSIFLISLALGETLNDSFQNFYARYKDKKKICISLHRKSIQHFILCSLILCFLVTLLVFSTRIIWDNNVHYKILCKTLPYLGGLIIITYISLSLNSYLIGIGKTKLLGIISVISIAINTLLGYFLLFIFNVSLNPCCTILLTSILAELVACFLMHYSIKKECNGTIISNENLHIKKISTILIKASVYPCLSEIVFHIGSLFLYLFCLYFMDDKQTAIFTLFMAYWGIMQVPSDSSSETSLNMFSEIYVKGKKQVYYIIKERITLVSLGEIIAFGLILYCFDVGIYGFENNRLFAFSILLIITGLNLNIQLTELSIFVQLKNDIYLSCKILYGVCVCISLIVIVSLFKVTIINILLSFLLAQIVSLIYIRTKEKKIWE